jgi:single-strand DNA-binding protein
MDGLNKIIIIGNLGADPELRILPGGNAVLKLRVATTESWLDKEKNVRNERTEWHRVAVFGKSAENLAKFLRKGMRVTIEGRNQTSSYEKEGQKHYSTEVIAVHVWAPPKPVEMGAFAASSAGESAPFAPTGGPGSNGAYGRLPPAPAATDIPF